MNQVSSSPSRLITEFNLAASRLDAAAWSELRGSRILLTGGTGFVGKWLLGSLLAADRIHHLGVQVCVLTRDPIGFTELHPELASGSGVEFVKGDICHIAQVLIGRSFTHVIHAATEASAKLNREDPLRMIDTIVNGTLELLRLLASAPPHKLLFVSSGAVYGPQPANLTGLPEDWSGGPDPLGAGCAYHEAKRLAEQLCAAAARSQGLPHVGFARLFAFVGPYLPLDTHFAIGNFIRDALAGKTITLSGDGSTVRSYLYAADMAAWIWASLLRGAHLRPYNIGSSHAVSTAELAHCVAHFAEPAVPVDIRGKPNGQPIDRYVPNTRRACDELGVTEWTSLADAIRLTITHHRAA